MIYSSNKFNLDFFLKEIHSTSVSIQEKKNANFHLLVEKFSFNSINEVISLAKTILGPGECRHPYLQLLASDIKVLSSHLSQSSAHSTSNPKFASLPIFGHLFYLRAYDLKENPQKIVSENSINPHIDFLMDFAPQKAEQFQCQSKTAVLAQYKNIMQEIESNISKIAKALAYRLSHLENCLKPSHLQGNLLFLYEQINQNRFNDTRTVCELLAQAFKTTNSKRAILDFLEEQYNNVLIVENTIQQKRSALECQKISDFLKEYVVIETGQQSKVHLASLCRDFFLNIIQEKRQRVLEDWLSAALINPLIIAQSNEFVKAFNQENSHAKKMDLLQIFLSKWCEIYPPNSRLGAEEIIRSIQACFMLSKSPEFLLNIVLLEENTICHSPESDYDEAEKIACRGIRVYNYASLSTAFICFCRESNQKIKNDPEIQVSTQYCKIDLDHSWQKELIHKKEFCEDAKKWALEFTSENNGIFKLNNHRAAMKEMQQAHAEFTLYDDQFQIPFLVALFVAANYPKLINAVKLIDEKSIGWKVAEGFIKDTPVNAQLRMSDYKDLKSCLQLFSFT